MKKRYEVIKVKGGYKIWDRKSKLLVKISSWKKFEGADEFCHEMNRLC